MHRRRASRPCIIGPSRRADRRPRPGSRSTVTNRLDQETSPYLLQHRDNPVDWWPWS
ncbi:MAG: DUF255 domain-containing protein, partial [Actinobacteria bacterium]|nr:DUF255 domain-containing protein [Actinomycetota bacterium]